MGGGRSAEKKNVIGLFLILCEQSPDGFFLPDFFVLEGFPFAFLGHIDGSVRPLLLRGF